MSDPKPEYITDSLEMIGITEPKQIVTEISGFIPVFDVVIQHYKDPMTALVFGRMWQYCGMEDGVCKASLDRIGKDLGISGATVMRHAEKLVNDGYLVDTTPNRRNAPHEYLDGRKVEMKSRFSGGIAERKPTVSQRNATVSTSQLIKQDNTILNNNDIPKNPKTNADTLTAFLGLQHESQVYNGENDEALKAFERDMQVSGSWSWHPAKGSQESVWRAFRKLVCKIYEEDNQAFTKYNTWRLQPYVKGAKINSAIKADPSCFSESYNDFLIQTGATKSQPKIEVKLDKHGFPITG